MQEQGGASIAVEDWSDEAVQIRFTHKMNAIEVPPPRTVQQLVWDTIYKWNLDMYNALDPHQFGDYRKTFAETPVGAALCLEFPLVHNPKNEKWSIRDCTTAMNYLESRGEARPSHLKVQCVWMQCMFCGALHGMR